MDYKRRFLLGGSKQKVQQQHQQYQMPELSRTLSASLASSCSASSPLGGGGGCRAAATRLPLAQPPPLQTSSKASPNIWMLSTAFLTDLFSSVFRNSHYSKAAMQLKDVQEHVMEAASRLTAAIKPEIAKMLMELSAGAANFKDQNDFSLQDVEVLGRCFLTVMQVHFQFLSQALQKVQPVAQSCLAEALAQAQERSANARSQSSDLGPLTELEEASRLWKGAAQAMSRLRERGRDGCLAGLQAYKAALESLGHSEYALKAGFHLNPKAVEAPYSCCSEAEAQQAGRMQTTSQPIQCELPTIPVQIGSHFLKGVSFNESAAENLKLKTLIKEALGQNGVTPRDDSPVTEVLNQVCPSSWRGACKTAVQLLFAQAGLVVVDTAQIENKEAYAPQITLEGSKVIVQVSEGGPATMSLLQRSLDPEKTLGLVDVLYTAVFDINRWKERKEQSLPTIQLQLQRETPDFNVQVDLPPGPCSKNSSGLPKSISKLTSKFTKKVSSSSNSGGSYSIPSTPSRSMLSSSSEDKSKGLGILQLSSLPGPPDPSQLPNGLEDQGMNLPTDQEMQDVIDFLSGFNMGKSQQASPLVKRRNSVASANPAELKPPSGAPPTSQSQPAAPHSTPTSTEAAAAAATTTTTTTTAASSSTTTPPLPQPSPQAMQYYQHLLQPISQQQQQQPPPPQQQTPPQVLPPQQRAPSKWLGGSANQQPPPPQQGPQEASPPWWGSPALPDLSSDLYSLGLVSTYMDSVMSEMLGQKPQGPRNNTWPNRDQSEGWVQTRSLLVTWPASVRPCSRNGRCSTSVALATHAATGQWLRAAQNLVPPRVLQRGGGGEQQLVGQSGRLGQLQRRDVFSQRGQFVSMFSGPDLVAAVKQRSCGEPEVCTLPSPPLHHLSDDNQVMTAKLRPGPPKLHGNTPPTQHHAQPQLLPVPDEPPPPLLPVETTPCRCSSLRQNKVNTLAKHFCIYIFPCQHPHFEKKGGVFEVFRPCFNYDRCMLAVVVSLSVVLRQELETHSPTCFCN
ncbi:hypothetical protein F7725_025962 [Dissostichus mawsoni]|uniref:DUF4745 domain-containing protein n=1 Tax=Dissostichus mawsoni TaxID=36200 RepID=A0A7J5X6L6_DISMA|nr:hypothetical protein F7725_025962 [Dissostichus mawsoni]